MLRPQIQKPEPAWGDGVHNLKQIGGELADPDVHGDFPQTDGTDENIIRRVGNHASSTRCQLVVTVQKPEQGMSVEQQSHGSSPSMAAIRSAGVSSKSGGIRI